MSLSAAPIPMPHAMAGFPLPMPPIAPFVHGPSPSQQSATVSDEASDDEDGPGGINDSPFFTETEMGNNYPVKNPELERNADRRFPSPYDFDVIVYEYLSSLSLKKREKALLNRTMYQAVLHVLNKPKDTTFKTAQFRFWAKKMFDTTLYSGEQVITHDHKPVAVREQIFEVLIHCHTQADHGGRDKTSIQVRKYYSWIPKEIIAKFVTKCPHCRSKRTMSSSSLGPMTSSQEFLAQLQDTEQNLSRKKPITLAAARAAALAATQEKAKPVYGKVALNQAHAQALAQQRLKAQARGRVHHAGHSHKLPTNAVYYHDSQSQFGSADYFNPSLQPNQYPQPMPTVVQRSVSYDGTAIRHNWNQAQAAEMFRRASDPIVYHPATGIDATPRATEILRQTHRLIHAPAQPIMAPEPAAEDFDSLQDVREGCRVHAETELSHDESPQQQLQSHVVDPAYQVQQHHIDPALVGQYGAYGQVYTQAAYQAYYPPAGPASSGAIEAGDAGHNEYAYSTDAVDQSQYYDTTPQMSYDQINASPYVQNQAGVAQYNQVNYNAGIDLSNTIGNDMAQYVQHGQTDAYDAEDISQYVNPNYEYGSDPKSDPAGPQTNIQLQPADVDVVDPNAESSANALGLVY